MMLQRQMSTSLPTKRNKTYTFVSQPTAIINNRKDAYNNSQLPTGNAPFGNLMHDRRIIRGNTYSLHATNRNNLQVQNEKAKTPRRRRRLRRSNPLSSQPTLDSSCEIPQTAIHKAEECSVECQTEEWTTDDSSSFTHTPALTNDVATQIYDGDLFDLQAEVKPVADLLAARVIEQALIEVMEEDELQHLTLQQDYFKNLQQIEADQLKMLNKQKEIYLQQNKLKTESQFEMLEREKDTGKKHTAHAFAQSFLSDLVPTVFMNLEQYGYINDQVAIDIEQGFIPWLMAKVCEELKQTDFSSSEFETSKYQKSSPDELKYTTECEDNPNTIFESDASGITVSPSESLLIES